MIFSGLC